MILMKIPRLCPVVLSTLLGYGILMANEPVGLHFTTQPYIDENSRLTIEIDVSGFFHYPVQDVYIHYREFSEANFKRERLQSEGFRYLASVDLSAYHAAVVEYFFDVELIDGTHRYFPEEAPQSNLYQISSNQEPGDEEDVIIISPEPNERIVTDEFILTVSFFKYSSALDKEKTKLFLNDWDVSRYARVFDDFLTFAPKQVPSGNHTIRLELYDTSGRLLTKKIWSFTAFERKGPKPETREFEIDGNSFAEFRTEELLDGSQSNQYSKAGLRLSGSTERFSFGTRLYISNQERGSVQPINRYTGWFQVNFWNNRYFRITGGDAFPQLNPFLLSNIFVRGVHGELFLRFLNLEVVGGHTRRSIEGREVPTVDAPGDTTLRVIGSSFKRNVKALRAGFDAGETMRFGITVLNGKDDPNSINVGDKPEETTAAGADISLTAHRKRFILEGSYNLSLYNPNILDGTDVPRDTLEKLGVDIKIYDLAKNIITINQNLIYRPQEAFQGQLRLNYFNNSLSVLYRFVEDNFHSLGQPFLLRDNRGFTITDNIRLFNNQVFLNLRYQEYKNNLNDDKPATITNRTLGFNFSYFPLQRLPSISIGYNNNSRKNGFQRATEDLLAIPEDNLTNTINISSSYSFMFSELSNRLSLNLINYNRTDNTDFKVDNLSNTIALILQTSFRFPLKTHIQATFQQTETNIDNKTVRQKSGNEFSINSFGAGLEYQFRELLSMRDVFTLAANGRYGNVSSRLSSELANNRISTISEYQRFFLNGRLIYSLPPYGRLSLNADMVNYTGARNFVDYIITARYDVTF